MSQKFSTDEKFKYFIQLMLYVSSVKAFLVKHDVHW